MLKNSEKVKNISLTILKGLALGSFVIAAMAFPGLALIFRNQHKPLRQYPKEKIKKSLWYLKKNDLVAVKHKNNKTILEITALGKYRLQKMRYDTLGLKTPKKWDKKWRLVVFDIAEKQKSSRELLRKKLLSLGFYKLQKSLYVHPFPCQFEIDLIKNILNVSSSVILSIVPKDELPERVYQHFKENNTL